MPSNIRALMLHLFQVYEKVFTKQLRTKYDKVVTMTYDMTKPIMVIFDAVNDQRELGELTGKSYTPSQIVYLTFLVVSNYPISSNNMRRWLIKHTPISSPSSSKFARNCAKRKYFFDDLEFQSINTIVIQIVN